MQPWKNADSVLSESSVCKRTANSDSLPALHFPSYYSLPHFRVIHLKSCLAGIVHACDPCTQEAEARGSPGVHGEPGLHSAFKFSLNYIARPWTLSQKRKRLSAFHLLFTLTCPLVSSLSLLLYKNCFWLRSPVTSLCLNPKDTLGLIILDFFSCI